MTIDEVVCFDFEYRAPDGEIPHVWCGTFHRVFEGKDYLYWRDELLAMGRPPFSELGRVLYVAFAGHIGDLMVFLQLGWGLPVYYLDMQVELRARTNGNEHLGLEFGLADAAFYAGCTDVDTIEKAHWQSMAMADRVWTEEEKRGLLEYCRKDTQAVVEMWQRFNREIPLDEAVGLRGAFCKAVAQIQHWGMPHDDRTLTAFLENWACLKLEAIQGAHELYGCFPKGQLSFSALEEYVARHSILWPRTVSKRLATDEDTLKSLVSRYPQLLGFQETMRLKHSLVDLKISYGSDKRLRTAYYPFGQTTGRNNPSTAKHIFNTPPWTRFLLRPAPEHVLTYVDFSQEEWAIAAHLSQDTKMMSAYEGGDPYLAFGLQSGILPKGATKKSHGPLRDQCKTACLAMMYGTGPKTLSVKLGISMPEAIRFIDAYRHTYSTCYAWALRAYFDWKSAHVITNALGWPLHRGDKDNELSVRNFPVQSNGSAILHIAVLKALRAGVKVVAMVHDALLIESSIDSAAQDTENCIAAMREAGKTILGGALLRTDTVSFAYPSRYRDPRGEYWWAVICGLLEKKGFCVDDPVLYPHKDVDCAF
jgi:DNA polymerase I